MQHRGPVGARRCLAVPSPLSGTDGRRTVTQVVGCFPLGAS